MQEVLFEHWGQIRYEEAWRRQEELMKKELLVKRGESERKETQHRFILCTHPHVYTLGKSGHESHLLANPHFLSQINAEFVRTNRGGDITYHGPGQIVGYPIVDLEKFSTDLGKYMRMLEEVIIRTINHYGLKGERLEGATGVWLDAGKKGKERKICAMGVRCSRWMTMHGFALNVHPNLEYFQHIIPCGIADKGVTSLQMEGVEASMQEVEKLIGQHFQSVFDVQLIPIAAQEEII